GGNTEQARFGCLRCGLGGAFFLKGVNAAAEQLALLLGTLTGQGTGDLGVGPEPHPGPFALAVLESELPGFSAVWLDSEIEPVAIQLAVFLAFRLKSGEHSIRERSPFDS